MINRISREEASKLAELLGLPAGPLSYSQIESYMKCQRSYFYKYILREPQPFSLVMALGDALHKGLETIHRELLVDNVKNRNSRSLAKYLDRGLHTSRLSVGTILKNAAVNVEGVETIKKQGACIEELLKLWVNDRLPEIDIEGAEEKFYIEANGVPLTIRIDLLRAKRVSDFKLTKRKKSEKDAQNSLQLSIYTLSTDVDEGSFISFTYPDPAKLHRWEPNMDEVVANKNPTDKEWAMEIIGAISKSIASDKRDKENFNPCNPADWVCSEDYCEWWSRCRGATKVKAPDWLSGKKTSKSKIKRKKL